MICNCARKSPERTNPASWSISLINWSSSQDLARRLEFRMILRRLEKGAFYWRYYNDQEAVWSFKDSLRFNSIGSNTSDSHVPSEDLQIDVHHRVAAGMNPSEEYIQRISGDQLDTASSGGWPSLQHEFSSSKARGRPPGDEIQAEVSVRTL